ncbi:MAG: hypothetical protein IKZ82_12325 [Clostridia bacterium]|nr:hypothetical protein [Clostridia bacterium]
MRSQSKHFLGMPSADAFTASEKTPVAFQPQCAQHASFAIGEHHTRSVHHVPQGTHHAKQASGSPLLLQNIFIGAPNIAH